MSTTLYQECPPSNPQNTSGIVAPPLEEVTAAVLAMNTFAKDPTQRYVVFARMLNSNMKGTDDYGYAYVDSVHPDKKSAETRAEQIIEETGMPIVFVTSTRRFFPLNSKYNPDNVEFVATTDDEKIFKTTKQDYDRHMKEEKKLVRARKLIEQHMLKENESDSIEHFSQLCYRILTYKQKIHSLQEELEKYKQGVEKVSKHLYTAGNKHPEFIDDVREHLVDFMSTQGNPQTATAAANIIADYITDNRDKLFSKSDDVEGCSVQNMCQQGAASSSDSDTISDL